MRHFNSHSRIELVWKSVTTLHPSFLLCLAPHKQTDSCKDLGNLIEQLRGVGGRSVMEGSNLKSWQCQEHTLAVSICITAATRACILLLLLWVEDFCRYNRWPECFHVQPRSERAVCHSPVRRLLIRQGHCYKWLFFTFGFLQLSFPFRLTHTFTCVVTCGFSLSPCPDCWPVWFFN